MRSGTSQLRLYGGTTKLIRPKLKCQPPYFGCFLGSGCFNRRRVMGREEKCRYSISTGQRSIFFTAQVLATSPISPFVGIPFKNLQEWLCLLPHNQYKTAYSIPILSARSTRGNEQSSLQRMLMSIQVAATLATGNVLRVLSNNAVIE